MFSSARAVGIRKLTAAFRLLLIRPQLLLHATPGLIQQPAGGQDKGEGQRHQEGHGKEEYTCFFHCLLILSSGEANTQALVMR